MAPDRVNPKSRSTRDLSLGASSSFTASTSSTSQVSPKDSRKIPELCYTPALAVYENNHNRVLSDVDEDDDDDNDTYDEQDEHGELDYELEQFYLKKIQKLAERKFEQFLRGELVLDPKKKKKKQIESFVIQDDLYASEDELVSKQNQMQIYKHQKGASSSKRPRKSVHYEDDEDDEEEYHMKKKRRNKDSSSKHPHKFVMDDSNEDNNMKNRPKKKIEPIISNEITERLKEYITHQLNGTNIMLVIQKQLFASDLAGTQNRLSMPHNQLETFDFLTEQEREYLLTQESADIDVPLLGPKLQMFNQSMKLTRWQINSTQSYVLRTNWRAFVQENKNDLKQGAIIQVWSYRKENKLGFAIAVVKRVD